MDAGSRIALVAVRLHAAPQDESLTAAIHERTNGTHNITWQLARPLRHGLWHVTVPDGIARSVRVDVGSYATSTKLRLT